VDKGKSRAYVSVRRDQPVFHLDEMRKTSPAYLQTLQALADPSFKWSSLMKFYPGHVLKTSWRIMGKVITHFHRCGEQSLVVQQHMQESFSRAKLDDVTSEMLRLPYEAFYVALPGTSLQIANPETGLHAVIGVYVQRRSNFVRFFLVGATNEEEKRRVAAGEDLDGSVCWFSINLDEHPDVDLESALSRVLSDPSNDCSDTEGVKLGALPKRHQEIMFDAFRSTLRIVVNLCLYMSCENADLEPADTSSRNKRSAHLKRKLMRARKPKQRRAIEGKLAALPQSTVVYVGRAYERLRSAVDAAVANGTWPRDQAIPHWRRAHFHRFWVGKRILADGTRVKGDRMVLHFIDPVPVNADGVDLSDVVGHVYKVR